MGNGLKHLIASGAAWIALVSISTARAEDQAAPAPAQSQPEQSSMAAAGSLADKSATAATALPSSEAPARGKFVVTFEDSKIDGMNAIRDRFKNDAIIVPLVNAVAQAVYLPQDTPISFRDCGTPNAFWQSEERAISFCYELIDVYRNGFQNISAEEKALFNGLETDDVLYGTTIFVLFHELGHGLVDMFKVPITGREEDAVDQLAALSLIDLDEKKHSVDERPSRYALVAAYFFKMLAEDPARLTRDAFSDEHALGQQRYYDVMCLVLGSDLDAYAPILTSGLKKASDEFEADPSADKSKFPDRARELDAQIFCRLTEP